MKKILLIASVLIAANISKANAQETIMAEINYTQLERYIEMAKAYYPQRQILNEQENIAKSELIMSNISYLDIFNANYFYRPDQKEAINPQNPYLINGFQFGVTLNLGDYLQKPFKSKSAKSSIKIVQLEKQILDTQLEKEVKSRYYNYILQLRELKLKTIDAQDVSGTSQIITNRFEKGEITLEEYNAARAAVSASASTKMQTEMDYLRAKDDLEEIIGSELSNN